MQISFLNPGFFILLALIPVLWFLPRKVDRKVQGILRSLLLALLVTALARPVLLAPSNESYQVMIVDRSASLSKAQQAEASRVLSDLTASATAGNKVTVIEVGGKPQRDGDSDAGQALRVDKPGSSSSLSAALSAAALQIPEGANGRVVLISDGLATDREWGDTVTQLIERGITVDTFDLGHRSDDIYPAALYTNGELRVGETASANVTVIGSGEVTVSLTDEEGNELASGRTVIDGRADVALPFEPKQSGFMSVTATVTTQSTDSRKDNNRLTSTFAVQEPLKVLYIGHRVQGSGVQLQKLVGAGFVIETPTQPLDGNFPLDDYQLVMIDDAPAKQLPKAFQQRVSDEVQKRGLGLVFAGGRGAFGEGGYYQTPVAEVLPIEFQQRSEKKEPTVALAIIIDTSGSMSGERIELAKQMARLSLNKLKKTDKVGVVEFYGAKSWAVPLQTMKSRSNVERAIGRMQATGSTILLPAIEEAFYGLQNVKATYKHIMVISDAGIESADFEGAIRKVAKAGITLSTVLPASGEDNAIMTKMARIGGGRFYAVPSQFNLVEINFRKPSETRLPAYKAGHYSVQARTGSGWWGEVNPADLPAVSGYVEVQARQGADVLLQTEGSAHPLLSSWRYGLGRVTAMMTEPVGSGTNSWQGWDDYGRMLARILSRTADDGRAFDYQIIRQDNQLHIDAVRSFAGMDTVPSLNMAEDAERTINFTEMAPGWFRTTLAVDASQALQFEETGHSQARYLNAPSQLVAEDQVDPERGLDLDRLAKATGGASLSSGEQASAMTSNADSLSLQKLWPWVLLLALFTYLGEIVYRRWPSKN
ncbi:VWA domain-containing protein [Porticoccaceae bacterium LTM1]|nr:VWA domain-containing protein [Porticoccaceae bacterium LTM1]